MSVRSFYMFELISLLFVLLTINIVSCDPLYFTLDIDGGPSPFFYTMPFTENDIETIPYFCYTDFYINCVRADGGQVIWSAEDGEYATSLLTQRDKFNRKVMIIRIITTNGIIFRRFRKLSDEHPWELHYDGISVFNEHLTELDLSTVMNPNNNIERTTYGNTISTLYIDILSMLVAVTHAGQIIWNRRSNSDDTCVHGKCYLVRGEFKLLELRILLDGSPCLLLFERGYDNIWNPISNQDFYTRSKLIRGSYSLDLNNIDTNESITVNLVELYGVPSCIYNTNADVYIMEIKIGDLSLWKSRDGIEYSKSVTVNLKNGVKRLVSITVVKGEASSVLYMRLEYDSAWVMVSRRIFHRTLFRINNEKSLKLGNYPEYVTARHDILSNNNMITIINPIPSVILTSLYDGDELIWESLDDDDECTELKYYTRRGDIILLFIKLYKYGTRILNSRKVNGNWTPIDPDEYNRLVNRIENEVLIDVNNKDYEDYCNIEEYEIYGTHAMSLTPKNNKRITGLVDGTNIIWDDDEWDQELENKKCTFIAIHYDLNGPKLLHLTIITTPPSDSDKYFVKSTDGTWENVTREQLNVEIYNLVQEQRLRDEQAQQDIE